MTVLTEPNICLAFWSKPGTKATSDMHGRNLLVDYLAHHQCTKMDGHRSDHQCECGDTAKRV